MAEYSLRIIFKPYGIRGGVANSDLSADGTYWRCQTEFPASKNGKSLFGKGIDRMSALSDLMTWAPAWLRDKLKERKEDEIYVQPDQMDFRYWVLELDGWRPNKDQWLMLRQFYNTFGHRPDMEWINNNLINK